MLGSQSKQFKLLPVFNSLHNRIVYFRNTMNAFEVSCPPSGLAGSPPLRAAVGKTYPPMCILCFLHTDGLECVTFRQVAATIRQEILCLCLGSSDDVVCDSSFISLPWNLVRTGQEIQLSNVNQSSSEIWAKELKNNRPCLCCFWCVSQMKNERSICAIFQNRVESVHTCS